MIILTAPTTTGDAPTLSPTVLLGKIDLCVVFNELAFVTRMPLTHCFLQGEHFLFQEIHKLSEKQLMASLLHQLTLMK